MQKTLFDMPNVKRCSLMAEPGGLALRTPYDAAFVQDLKASIPVVGRTFDRERKLWIIDEQYANQTAQLVDHYFAETLNLPPRNTQQRIEQRLLEIRYIGKTKERGESDRSAFAWVNGSFSVIIPENALRVWFEQGTAMPGQATTLYGILGVPSGVDADGIKVAYRRMARQWHPDVCRELNAAEQFLLIQNAYDVLSQPNKRARYDAGLALQASLNKTQMMESLPVYQYQPPLRCGWVLAEGKEVVGRFVVEKILAWEDITNAQGKVLTTSWVMNSNAPLEAWV
jgi:hypothetical protein